MDNRRWRWAFAVLALSVAGAGPLGAAYVRPMNLRELSENADRVLRGTVVEISRDTVEAGGGSIPILRYRVRVNESLKGSATAGGEVEIRMVDPKAGSGRSVGSALAVSRFAELPRLSEGQEYLLFLTRPSSVGLSTTVGLGQGCFRVHAGREITVVNERDNVGLFRDMPERRNARGAMRYSDMAGEIRRLRDAR